MWLINHDKNGYVSLHVICVEMIMRFMMLSYVVILIYGYIYDVDVMLYLS